MHATFLASGPASLRRALLQLWRLGLDTTKVHAAGPMQRLTCAIVENVQFRCGEALKKEPSCDWGCCSHLPRVGTSQKLQTTPLLRRLWRSSLLGYPPRLLGGPALLTWRPT